MNDDGAAPARKPDLSFNLLSDLALVLDSLGREEFYSRLSKALAHFMDSSRYLTIRYSQYSRPEFLVNEGMSASAIREYLDDYYRIDPVLRMVREEATRPIMTFVELRRTGSDSLFYDAMYQAAEIRDELVILLPAIGGVYIAICIDRANRVFTEEEVLKARLIYPMIERIHALHTYRYQGALTHISDKSDIAIMIRDVEGTVVFRNTAWQALANVAFEEKLWDLVQAIPSGTERLDGAMVMQWETLDSMNPIAPGGKALLVEKISPGLIDFKSTDLISAFAQFHGLTRRETEITTLTLAGEPTVRIAKSLGVSEGTIRNHRYRIYNKLDITTERELFREFFIFLSRPSEKPV